MMYRDPELQLSAQQADGIGMLELTGDLLSNTRLEPERILRDWIDHSVLRIVVRCAGLQQIDSAGLSALLSAIPRVRRRGGDIVLTEVNPRLKALFQVASIKRYFKTFGTLEEALDYLRPLELSEPVAVAE